MQGDTMHLAGVYLKTTAKAWFQYRVDAVMRSLAVFLREATGVIVIELTMMKFGYLNGWNVYELLFSCSLLFLTYGILIIFFTGLRDFGNTVRKGEFDRYLLRPRGLLFQIIFINADWFAAVGHGSLGLTLFLGSAHRVGMTWHVGMVIYYLLAVLGGVLIQGALFLLLASLNFYLLETDTLKELLYYDMKKFAVYPISIYHKGIQFAMMYVVPFAFVNYFPAQFFLRKPDGAVFPVVCLYLTPVVGAVLYGLVYLFWRYSIRYYKSAGN